MSVKIRVNKNKIYLDVYIKGVRKWESTGLSTCKDPKQNKEIMKLAEILRSRKEIQIVTRENDLMDPIKRKDTLYSHLKNKPGKLPLWTARYLESFPGGTITRLEDVSPTWVSRFKEYLLTETTLHQNTARNYLKEIKHTLNQAVKDNILPRNPADGVQNIKFIEPDRLFLNEDELELFSKVNSPSEIETCVKKAFMFSCLTGIRLSDLKTLKWENIDHSTSRTLLIKRQIKTKTKIHNIISKSSWDIINNQEKHDPSQPVFPYMSRVAGSSAEILARLGQRAGITKRISWHVARRTFALQMLENGVDIFTVSKLLGHAKIATTIIYLQMTSKLGKKAISTLPEITLSGSEWHPPSPPTLQMTIGDPEGHTPQDPPSENITASRQD
jgi:site-specific recombinase XerD